MQYILLIYGDENAWANAGPDDQAMNMKEWGEYTEWLKDEGTYLAGDALHPTSEATTLRFGEGEPITTDGPFAETKEQLGGYYLLECKDLDQAIEATKRIPVRAGSVEIRPVQVFDEQGRPIS